MSKTTEQQDAIIGKNIRVVYKIYNKMKTQIKTTSRELDHSNFSQYLIIIMRELNKNKLFGLEKKVIAVELMTLLLCELGLPHVVAHYSAEVISGQIEHIYNHGFHRYKRPCKWRFWR